MLHPCRLRVPERLANRLMPGLGLLNLSKHHHRYKGYSLPSGASGLVNLLVVLQAEVYQTALRVGVGMFHPYRLRLPERLANRMTPKLGLLNLGQHHRRYKGYSLTSGASGLVNLLVVL